MPYYDVAVSFGMVFGVILLSSMVVFIQKIEARKFKQYLLERSDKTRLDLKKQLDGILATYDDIAIRTNTKMFKRQANRMRKLISELNDFSNI